MHRQGAVPYRRRRAFALLVGLSSPSPSRRPVASALSCGGRGYRVVSSNSNFGIASAVVAAASSPRCRSHRLPPPPDRAPSFSQLSSSYLFSSSSSRISSISSTSSSGGIVYESGLRRSHDGAMASVPGGRIEDVRCDDAYDGDEFTLRRGKWEFLSSSYDYDDDDEKEDGRRRNGRRRGRTIRSILVCGDGDLSHCASMSRELHDDHRCYDYDDDDNDAYAPPSRPRLIATVLEDIDDHLATYRDSRTNSDTIASFGQYVMYGIDATMLSTYDFGVGGGGGNCRDDDENNKGDYNDDDSMTSSSSSPSSPSSSSSITSFDRVQFNFPHWKGKSNNRYNRQLLSDFLGSASTVLSPHGEVHVALCDGQGGCSSSTLQEWRGSWTASMLAADHGLLLARVVPYDAKYNLSSHRGVDRPFKLGTEPMMHIFVRPNGIVKAPRDIQLCCRHELHVVIPATHDGNNAVVDGILEGDVVRGIVQRCVPDGIRVEIPARKIVDVSDEPGSFYRVAVFLVAYCGERHHVTREMADKWRERAELEVSRHIPLRENRRGRLVSRPFPYPALYPEIKYRHVWLDRKIPSTNP